MSSLQLIVSSRSVRFVSVALAVSYLLELVELEAVRSTREGATSGGGNLLRRFQCVYKHSVVVGMRWQCSLIVRIRLLVVLYRWELMFRMHRPPVRPRNRVGYMDDSTVIDV